MKDDAGAFVYFVSWLLVLSFSIGLVTACRPSSKTMADPATNTETSLSFSEKSKGNVTPVDAPSGRPDVSEARSISSKESAVERRLPTPPPPPTAIPIPTFPPADVPAVGSEPPRRLDPEIEALDVEIVPTDVDPGERYWRVVSIRWNDPYEAAYRHYVWVRTRDEYGNPVAGVPVVFEWATGESSGPTPIDFPMYAAGHSYAVRIDGGIPSEKVTGMGLGTPSSRYTTDHVEYFVTFQIAVRLDKSTTHR